MQDSSTGKSRSNSHAARERKQQLLALFVVGLCGGTILSERLYVRSSRAALAAQQQAADPAAAAADGGGMMSGSSSTGGSQVFSASLGSKPAPRRLGIAGGSSSGAGGATAAASLSGTLSMAAVAGALAAEVAAAEAAAVAAISEAAVKADPQMRALEAYLRKVAPSREVLVGVSNVNPLREGMLDTFLQGISQAGVTNYVIVTLDAETQADLQARTFNAFHMPVPVSRSQAGTGDNHAISALKFGILRRFLSLGWAVLLSDIDVCVLQDPFKFLYRDHDVEGMSDGFNADTAYGAIEGYEDASMGWSRFAQKESHFNLNSGLFYVASNLRTIELMERLETRLARQKYWDQTAYNEEIFFLSHDAYRSPKVSVRVMSIFKFVNSKVLFKDVRHRPYGSISTPVMVHINYHPDKHERMKAVFKYYLQKDQAALAPFPGGSEPGS